MRETCFPFHIAILVPCCKVSCGILDFFSGRAVLVLENLGITFVTCQHFSAEILDSHLLRMVSELQFLQGCMSCRLSLYLIELCNTCLCL